MNLVAADRLESLLRQASHSCPQHTLGILIEGLEHHLNQRQRREFQVSRTLQTNLHLPIQLSASKPVSSPQTQGPNCGPCTPLSSAALHGS